MKLIDRLPWAIKCKLCGKRCSRSSGRILVRARQDKSMSSVMFAVYEEGAMKLLRGLSAFRGVDTRLRIDLTSKVEQLGGTGSAQLS